VIDRFGCETAGNEASLAAWDEAWRRYLHFRGSPLDALADANADDDEFVLGPVMSGLYSVLAGSPLDAAAVADNLDRARRRVQADDPRGLGHLEAFEHVCRGDFTAAADGFVQRAGPTASLSNATIGPADTVRAGKGSAEGFDFAALRFAHDLYLHAGAVERRCEAEAELVAAWPADESHRGFVWGMHAFSLTEVGRHHEAEQLGTAALAADPEDLWARHALAHVYENTDDTPRSLELLADTVDIWGDQDLLAVHMWWHLGLRRLAAGDFSAVLGILDHQMQQTTTAFELCDHTSLLWRAEFAGTCAADRWDTLADRWDQVAERHTCAFVDLHAALAFIRRPHHPGADRWFAGLAAREHNGAEIDDVFAEVLIPLIEALRSGDPLAFADGTLLAGVHRIGGSEAQRRIVAMAVEHLACAAGQPGVAAECTTARPDTPASTSTPSPSGTSSGSGAPAPAVASDSENAAGPPHASALADDPARTRPTAGPVSAGWLGVTAEAGGSRA